MTDINELYKILYTICFEDTIFRLKEMCTEIVPSETIFMQWSLPVFSPWKRCSSIFLARKTNSNQYFIPAPLPECQSLDVVSNISTVHHQKYCSSPESNNTVLNVPGDGNCLPYAALISADFLHNDIQIDLSPATLRKENARSVEETKFWSEDVPLSSHHNPWTII